MGRNACSTVRIREGHGLTSFDEVVAPIRRRLSIRSRRGNRCHLREPVELVAGQVASLMPVSLAGKLVEAATHEGADLAIDAQRNEVLTEANGAASPHLPAARAIAKPIDHVAAENCVKHRAFHDAIADEVAAQCGIVRAQHAAGAIGNLGRVK